MITDDLSSTATKGDIVRLYDKIETLIKAVTELQSRPVHTVPCNDFLRHLDHHSVLENKIDVTIKDILILKNRTYGFLIGVGLGGGAAGGGLVMGLLKLLGSI